MSRILFHPNLLPRATGCRVRLTGPWSWWQTRIYPGADGNLFHQCYDDPRDCREASILFDGCGQDVEIVDPPSMRLVMELPDYINEWGLGGPLRSLVQDRGPHWGELELVWHTQPGVRWLRLPGNTCLAGEYSVNTCTRDERRRLDDSSTRMHFSSGMPSLRWTEELELQALAAAMQVPTHVMMTPAQALAARYGEQLPVSFEHDGEVLTFDGVGWAAGVIEPQQIPRIPGLIADPISLLPSRRPNVLPESEVIDEIDRLVNEQVRGGPVDDYNINRYPRCKHCHHDWHGILCEKCACLGELEDPI